MPERPGKNLKKHHAEIAALIMEPMVQGAAGMIVFPRGYVKAARELCTRYQVLFIADEVRSVLAERKMFACEHENVRPDLMAIARGSPAYAAAGSNPCYNSIYAAFLGEVQDLKTFYHGHTYTGNPVACAAALANLDVLLRSRYSKPCSQD